MTIGSVFMDVNRLVSSHFQNLQLCSGSTGSRLWSARSDSLGLLIVDTERLQQAQVGCTAMHPILTAQHPVKTKTLPGHLQQQTSHGRAVSHTCALKHHGKGEDQSASTPSAHKLSVSEQNHEYFSKGGGQKWPLNGQQSIAAKASTNIVESDVQASGLRVAETSPPAA